MPNPYAVLGVSSNASKAHIKRAYMALAKKWHPDVNKAPSAEKKFQEITQAYQAINDPKFRYQPERDPRNPFGTPGGAYGGAYGPGYQQGYQQGQRTGGYRRQAGFGDGPFGAAGFGGTHSKSGFNYGQYTHQSSNGYDKYDGWQQQPPPPWEDLRKDRTAAIAIGCIAFASAWALIDMMVTMIRREDAVKQANGRASYRFDPGTTRGMSPEEKKRTTLRAMGPASEEYHAKLQAKASGASTSSKRKIRKGYGRDGEPIWKPSPYVQDILDRFEAQKTRVRAKARAAAERSVANSTTATADRAAKQT